MYSKQQPGHNWIESRIAATQDYFLNNDGTLATEVVNAECIKRIQHRKNDETQIYDMATSATDEGQRP